jgi:hypothetical protein
MATRLTEEEKLTALLKTLIPSIMGSLSKPSTHVNSSHGGVINEDDKFGKTLANEASKALSTTKFDGKPKSARIFQLDLQKRSKECKWEQHEILTFNGMNLLTNHGQITLDTIERAGRHSSVYADPTNTTQRSLHLLNCLQNSITETLRLQLEPKMSSCHELVAGPYFFKLLMTECKSAPSAIMEIKSIRCKLSKEALVADLKRMKYDVKSYNLHTEQLLNDLTC